MLFVKENSYRDEVSDNVKIELICDDMLLEIFQYCNAVELKEAALVCRRWNRVIGSSAVTMKKFNIKISKEMIKNRLQSFTSTRNHQNFYIVDVEDSKDLMVFADNFDLARVKSFELRCRSCQLISCDILQLLSKMTKLENLNLIPARWNVSEESTQIFEMPNLKTLLISSSYLSILKYIGATDLHDLQFTECTNMEDYQAIAMSLMGFTTLKRLTLRSCTEMFEHIDVSEIKFKLNFIEIYHKAADPVNVDVYAENLRKFLLLQVDCLQELRFDFGMFDTTDGQRIAKDVLRITFNECEKLTSLDISNASIPCDASFYQGLSPSRSLKCLKVHWNFKCDVVGGLLQKCPSLEQLHTEYCYLENDELNYIAELCEKLIHLDTYKLTGIAEDVVFKNLKVLDICKIEYSFDPLITMVAESPVSEKINIVECRNAEAFPVDLILRNPSMKKLIVQDKCYEVVTVEDNVRRVEESYFKQA